MPRPRWAGWLSGAPSDGRAPHSPTSIVEELSISRQTVKSALNRIKKRGAIMKAGKDGLWTIPGGKDTIKNAKP